MSYFKLITVCGYQFPVTTDGLLINPRYYPKLNVRGNLDSTWENALIQAVLVFETIQDAVSEINSGAGDFRSYEDAERYVKYMRNVDRFDVASGVVKEWLNEEWLELPDDLEWMFIAIHKRLHPPSPPINPSKPTKVIMPDPGYVYLIQSPTGVYKIGRAKNPDNRMETFSVKLPFEVAYIHLIPCENYRHSERQLHIRYADKRINGEWFDLTPEDVAWIKSIETGGDL